MTAQIGPDAALGAPPADGQLYGVKDGEWVILNARDDGGNLAGTVTLTLDHQFQSTEATVASAADVTVAITPPFLTHTIWLTPADATPTLAFSGGTITWDDAAPDFADNLTIQIVLEALSSSVIRGFWKAIA